MPQDSSTHASRFPSALMLLCFVTNMVDGLDILMIGFVGPLLMGSLHMGRGALGLVISAGFLGTVLGSVLFGSAADRFGRRRALLVALAGFGLLTLLCIGARSAWQMAGLRFLAGLGMGGAMPVIAAIVAAHAPARSRASWVTLTYMGMPFGVVVGGSLAAALMPLWGWIPVFLISGGGALALLLPAWYLVPADRRPAAHQVAASPAPAARGALLRRGRIASACALWVASFGSMVLAGFLISFIPTLLNMQGMPPARAALGSVVFNIGAIAGGWLLAALSRRYEPFKASMLAFAAAALMTVALGRLLGRADTLFGLLFVLGACLIGGELTIPALASRVFPERVRAGGVGWTLAIGRTGSIAGPAVGGWLLQTGLGVPDLFVLASVFPLLCVLGVALSLRGLPPATDGP